jgi:hypothetical protein
LITLAVALSIIVGSAAGWYGHKAIARIQAWGRNMDEQDPIFQALTEPEECVEFLRDYAQTTVDAHSIPTLANGAYSIGAAPLK